MKTEELKPKIEKWLEVQEFEKERSKNTISQYTRSLKLFTEFVESTGTEEIDKQTVIAYKKNMLEQIEENKKHPKPGRTQLTKITTLNTRLMTVNRFLKESGEPGLTVMLARDGDENISESVLTEQEYQRILEWADKLGKERIKLIMETLVGTGIRISELVGITVESLKTRQGKVTNKGKTRTIYIPKQLTKKLKAYCKKNNITEGVVFHGRDKNKLIDQAYIRKEMKLVAGKARGIKLDKVHPHALRHILARRYANMPNPNPYALPLILGHSIKNLPVTFRYTAPSREELLKIIDEIEAYYTEPKKPNGRNKKK